MSQLTTTAAPEFFNANIAGMVKKLLESHSRVWSLKDGFYMNNGTAGFAVAEPPQMFFATSAKRDEWINTCTRIAESNLYALLDIPQGGWGSLS